MSMVGNNSFMRRHTDTVDGIVKACGQYIKSKETFSDIFYVKSIKTLKLHVLILRCHERQVFRSPPCNTRTLHIVSCSL